MITILQKQEIINKMPTADLWNVLIEAGWKHCEVCNEFKDEANEGWDYEHNNCTDCSLNSPENNADYQNDLTRDEV